MINNTYISITIARRGKKWQVVVGDRGFTIIGVGAR